MSKRVRFIAVNNTTAARLRRALAASEVIKLPKYVSGRTGFKQQVERAIAGNGLKLAYNHAVMVCNFMPAASEYDIYAVSDDAASSFLLMSTDFDIKYLFANTFKQVNGYASGDLKQYNSHLLNLIDQQLEHLGQLRYLAVHFVTDVADLIADAERAVDRYAELIKSAQAEMALIWDNKW